MKLTVIFVDRNRTIGAIAHENSFIPYSFRSVQIEFTPEQLELLKLRKVDRDNSEEYFNCFLEE